MGNSSHEQERAESAAAPSCPEGAHGPGSSLPQAGPPPASYTALGPRGPLSEAQKDAVARLVVQGRPLNMIAMAVGRSPEAIRRMIDGSLKPKIEEVRAQVIRETSTHWFEMLAMLPQARQNMQSALLSADERVRVDMTKWVHQAIVPQPAQVHETEVNVNLGEGAVQLLSEMNERLLELASANRGRDPLARVRTGPEALPRAVVVEAQVEPERRGRTNGESDEPG